MSIGFDRLIREQARGKKRENEEEEEERGESHSLQTATIRSLGLQLGILDCAAPLDVLLVQFVSWRIPLTPCGDCNLSISLIRCISSYDALS